MQNIVMLLSNAFRPDPRVVKEANSLAEAGYDLSIICWDRKGEFPAEETLPNGVRVLRIQNIHTVYGAGVKQILYTPRFWKAAMRKAIPLTPDLVHCHDLDTLYAGVQIKKQVGCKLIFDAHEDYPTQMSLYLPVFFVPLLNQLERWLLRQVDATIAASSLFADKLTRIGFSPIIYLPNVQELVLFERVTGEQVAHARQELGLQPEDYVVGYIGGFSRNRVLLPLIEAMRSLPSTTLLLWGDGHQRQAVEQAISGLANVRYLGWLSADQVPLYTCMSDVVYYCLKPDYPGAKYNAPNTLSNAIAAGRPVIANNLGDLGRIVRENSCGILLDEVTPESIGKAIVELSDPTLRNKLGEAGRRAAHQSYNWQVAEQRLLRLYHSLLLAS
ncbi:MAG: glycosyltransferase family 4 protein [Anaerolineales bacterium]